MTRKDRMRRIHSERVIKAIDDSEKDVEDIYGAKVSEEAELLDLLGNSEEVTTSESEVSNRTIIVISSILLLVLGGVLIYLVYKL